MTNIGHRLHFNPTASGRNAEYLKKGISMATKTLTDESYEKDIQESEKPVLVDFWAEWCGPCKTLGPVLEEISNERDDIVIAKMDIDSHPETASTIGVRGIPTMILYKDGKVVDMRTGSATKAAIEEWLSDKI